MFIRSAAVLLLAASTAFAQPTDNKAPIAEATAMMDAGNVDAAIAKLKGVLVSEPSNTTALTLLGNCFDQLGDRKKAMDTYRRGLKIAPDDAQLNFSLAVSLVQAGRGDDARAIGKHGARKNPGYASEHYLLGKVFAAQGYTVPAILSYLHFLALEPAGNRAVDAATSLRRLLGQGIEKTGKGYNVNIDTNAPKDEGDYSGMQMMVTLLVGGAAMQKEQKKSEFESSAATLSAVIGMYVEMEDKGPANYTRDVQRPFFTAMQKQKLVDVFAGLALTSLNLPGMTEWLKANEKSIEAYLAWIHPLKSIPGV